MLDRVEALERVSGRRGILDLVGIKHQVSKL